MAPVALSLVGNFHQGIGGSPGAPGLKRLHTPQPPGLSPRSPCSTEGPLFRDTRCHVLPPLAPEPGEGRGGPKLDCLGAPGAPPDTSAHPGTHRLGHGPRQRTPGWPRPTGWPLGRGGHCPGTHCPVPGTPPRGGPQAPAQGPPHPPPPSQGVRRKSQMDKPGKASVPWPGHLQLAGSTLSK